MKLKFIREIFININSLKYLTREERGDAAQDIRLKMVIKTLKDKEMDGIKEIDISVRIEDGKLKSLVKRNGFEDSPLGILEVIGILENLKQLEMDKLKKSHQEQITNKEYKYFSEDDL